MSRTRHWREFFALEAPRYMNEPFVKATLAEVDFLVEELRLQPGMRVLDVGCGTGRHCVELARRGYRVSGVDLSADMLKQARGAARAAGVKVEFRRADATRLSLPPCFDAAICLCEGALCLLGVGEDVIEHDRAILAGIHRALKPGGGLLLTALNGFRVVKKLVDGPCADQPIDVFGLVEHESIELPAADGSSRRFTLPQRHYVPSELAMLLRWTGFEVRAVYGGTAGNWGRRAVELDEMELMAVARKPKASGRRAARRG